MSKKGILASYELTAIPLDTVGGEMKPIGQFNLSLSTSLSFRKPSNGGLTASEIQTILECHPCGDLYPELGAKIYGEGDQLIAVAKLERTSLSFSETLERYVFGDAQAIAGEMNLPVEEYFHDPAFDELTESNHLNTAELYYHGAMIRSLSGLVFDSQRAKRRKLLRQRVKSEGSNYADFVPHRRMRHSLSETLREVDSLIFQRPGSTMRAGVQLPVVSWLTQYAASSVNRNLTRYKRLLYGEGVEGQGLLRQTLSSDPVVDEQTLSDRVNRRELNTLFATAAKEPLLAKALGIRTDWKLTITEGNRIEPGVPYFLRVTFPGCGKWDPIVSVSSCPTAFEYARGVIAPRLMVPGKPSQGMAWLNDSDQRRYRVCISNIDAVLSDSLLVQQDNRVYDEQNTATSALASCINREPSNSRTNPETNFDAEDKGDADTSSPQKLNDKGIPQTNTQGVSFFSPIEDLVTQEGGGVTECNGERALFDEHLHQGYCISVATQESTEGSKGQPNFKALSSAFAEYTLDAPKSDRPLLADGVTEIVIDKEQLTFEGSTDASGNAYRCQSRYQETKYFHWTGEGKANPNPLSGISQIDRRIEVNPPYHKKYSPLKSAYDHLLFRQEYGYFVRKCYQGGARLSNTQAANALSEMHAIDRRLFVQNFQFFRSSSFKPGVLIDPDANDGGASSLSDEYAVTLTSKRDRKTLLIAPSPLDFEQARFHGLVGKSHKEPKRFGNYWVATDLRRFYTDHGEFKPYFKDPDVCNVRVTVLAQSRNTQEAPAAAIVNEAACDVFPHLLVGQVVLAFGPEGRWEEYEPLELTICGTSRDVGKIRETSSRSAEVRIPPGDDYEIYITPELSKYDLRQHAFYEDADITLQDLRAELSDDEGRRQELQQAISSVVPSPDVVAPELEVSSAVTEQLSIRARHAVQAPLHSPKILDLDVRRRPDDSSAGYVHGIVEVEPRTVGSIVCRFAWSTRVDNVKKHGPQWIDGPGDETEARGLMFGEIHDELPDSIAQAIEGDFRRPIQCAETHVIYGGKEGPSDGLHSIDSYGFHVTERSGVVPGKLAKLEKLPSTHVQLTARAHAISRFASVYQGVQAADSERYSDEVKIDLLNIVSGRAPAISHVLPLIATRKLIDSKERSTIESSFFVRIYIDRPWCLMGNDDRLAIACSSTRTPDPLHTTYATQWGEDVFERPKYSQTRYMPRASDFVAPEAKDDNAYLRVVEYYDNVEFRPASDVGASILLDLASFEVNYSESQQLWFAEFGLREKFSGWMQLVVFRHQPKSVVGKELSEDAEIINVAMLQRELLTYKRRGKFLHVTVGPVFDDTVGYEITRTNQLSGVAVTYLGDPIPMAAIDTTEGRLFKLSVEVDKDEKLTVQRTKVGKVQAAIALI
ncbi:MAG: hypothetical protein AB2796_13625 [Candidatus Thiodiazotropha sp.]